MNMDGVLNFDVTQLPDDVEQLRQIIAGLLKSLQERNERIASLEQHLHVLVKRWLGKKGEKWDPRQMSLFGDDPNAAAAETDVTTMLTCIGDDVTTKLEWRPSAIVAVEHHQMKYVVKSSGEEVVASSAPPAAEAADATVADPPANADTATAAADADESPAACTPSASESSAIAVATGAVPQVDEVAVPAATPSPTPLSSASDQLIEEYFAAAAAAEAAAEPPKISPPTNNASNFGDLPESVRLHDAFSKQKCQARFWTYVGNEEHPFVW